MTAVALSARNDRVPCPEPGCTYTMDYAGSIPAHVAMAHRDDACVRDKAGCGTHDATWYPVDERCSARGGRAAWSSVSVAGGDDPTCVGSNHVPHCEHFPATPAVSLAAGVALLEIPDSDDQHWLDDRIASINDGIGAVLDIAREWSDGRNLSRLHPGTSAQDYILARVKHPLGRGVVLPLLAESDWSNRQIATIAGVDEGTVRNVQRRAEYSAPERGPVLGADNKVYAPRVVQAVVIDTPSEHPSAGERGARQQFCRMTSKSTGQGCQQPERWAMTPPAPAPMEVCQQHGKMLERQGWRFIRELHPVPGFDRDGRLASEAEA